MAQPILPANENTSRQAPRVINVDKKAAYPKAIAELKASGVLPASVELRQVKGCVKRLQGPLCANRRAIKRIIQA